MNESTAYVLIRRSTGGDVPALRRLAALGGQTLRGSSFLLAEVEGELVAAVSLDARAGIIGPSSEATDDVRELLRRLVRNIRRHDAASLRRAA